MTSAARSDAGRAASCWPDATVNSQRQVAIKQLPAGFAADPTVRRPFASEARLLASLDHPHVVPVYDFVQRDELCVLVMELLPGGTVWSRFTSNGFSAPSAVAVALACAAGLKAAHDQGILHRDVKPENLMFGARGALKVTDFGIAKMVGGGETLATRAGDVLGTPAYMAPEQARGGALSAATDVYGLATMLYELLAGVLPFADDGDAMALLFKHAFEAPIPLGDVAPAIPADVISVVMRGLATDPSERFATADAFGIALASGDGPNGDVLAARHRRAGTRCRHDDVCGQRAGATHRAGHASVHRSSDPLLAARGDPARRNDDAPAAPVRAPAVALSNVAAADLVPVQQLVPPRAMVPAVAATVLALAAILVALIGLGGPARGGSLRSQGVSVNGHAVTGGARVRRSRSSPRRSASRARRRPTTCSFRCRCSAGRSSPGQRHFDVPERVDEPPCRRWAGNTSSAAASPRGWPCSEAAPPWPRAVRGEHQPVGVGYRCRRR